MECAGLSRVNVTRDIISQTLQPFSCNIAKVGSGLGMGLVFAQVRVFGFVLIKAESIYVYYVPNDQVVATVHTHAQLYLCLSR